MPVAPTRLLLAGVTAVTLAACGDGQSRTAAPSDSTVSGTVSVTGDADGCSAEATPSSYTDSSHCLYEAFRAGDRELASAYATSAAVGEVFELGGYPTDDQWVDEGCGPPRETTPSSGIACHFTIPGDVHGVTVELAMRRDFVVEDVRAVG